ncbi:hypothetical protein [Noviherbaspirillum massiliense]|uniref:hypothetical protein n=1 Tax=Noviherbaspirillum massiliense TaxID=1465823 RepID=UPI0002FDA8CA|nr:hypothetical protein [Noviherbaspirillum massiliense]
MNSIPESKKSHLWRKIIWHTDPEVHPLGPYHSIEIYCCEEANGYSIWYVRRLGKDDHRGIPGMENADYLLGFYGKNNRDAALERAVLIANSDPEPDKVIQTLDKLAAAAQKV